MPAACDLGVYPSLAEHPRWIHKTVLFTKSAKHYDSKALHCILLPAVIGH